MKFKLKIPIGSMKTKFKRFTMNRRREQKPASWGIETLPPESFRASYWLEGYSSLSPIGRKVFGEKSPVFFSGSTHLILFGPTQL